MKIFDVSWTVEMVTYLFSRWGLGTLLMLLVGSYFLGRYYIKRRTGNVQWRDLLWGLILTVWGLIMTVWMPHYSWDAFAMYAGIFAGRSCGGDCW